MSQPKSNRIDDPTRYIKGSCRERICWCHDASIPKPETARMCGHCGCRWNIPNSGTSISASGILISKDCPPPVSPSAVAKAQEMMSWPSIHEMAAGFTLQFRDQVMNDLAHGLEEYARALLAKIEGA